MFDYFNFELLSDNFLMAFLLGVGATIGALLWFKSDKKK
jgi:hypothetical protein